MKRLLCLFLTLLLLLSACAPAEDPNQNGNNEPDIGAEEPGTGDKTPEDTPSQDEPPVKLDYVNPLNGQGLAQPYTGRPVAVMLNNLKQAMPQHGVSQADILFEILAEGGITRCMGIFSDISKVEKVGSIRSARKYYVQIAQGFGAMYVHLGGTEEALDYLKTIKGMDINGQRFLQYFMQDKDRLNSGYSAEHTWFIKGSKVLECAQSQKYQTGYDSEKSYGMEFEEKVIAGKAHNKVTVYFNKGGTPGNWTKSTSFAYDKETKMYSASQHGGNYIDGNTKKTVSFRNVLALKMPTSGDYLQTINTVGSGAGYYCANGQMVEILWSRASVNDPLTYTLKDGTPLTFSPGATYIGVIPTNATVAFQ